MSDDSAAFWSGGGHFGACANRIEADECFCLKPGGGDLVDHIECSVAVAGETVVRSAVARGFCSAHNVDANWGGGCSLALCSPNKPVRFAFQLANHSKTFGRAPVAAA